jgi:Tfp pilus assembly protein PilF
MTTAQALQVALGHHHAGRLAEAEGIYRQILAVEPRHAGALHLLGVVAHQAGHHEAALDLIRRAIGENPAAASFHNNLGNVLWYGRCEPAAPGMGRGTGGSRPRPCPRPRL